MDESADQPPPPRPEDSHVHSWYICGVNFYFNFLNYKRTKVMYKCWCGGLKMKRISGEWTLEELQK